MQQPRVGQVRVGTPHRWEVDHEAVEVRLGKAHLENLVLSRCSGTLSEGRRKRYLFWVFFWPFVCDRVRPKKGFLGATHIDEVLQSAAF